MPSSNPLPPKENALFKRILRCYEHKQYKNGLKFAKQILSNPKFTEHGETLAMKGLTLNCLGRKAEAYACVRRGLRNDLQSHVCWHVFGLLQRSDKKYDDAIKCYRNALKWEKDNIQILRDLSLLQIQMRDLEGYRDTRYQLLMLKPTQRVSWVGYAMSFHLLNDYRSALAILKDFMEQQKESYDYEHSELLLYQNMVLRESGDLTAALEHLQRTENQILDRLAVEETFGELLLKLGKFEEAEKYYNRLLERNAENREYYFRLIEAKQLTVPADILALYAELERRFPKAMPPRRLPLNVAEGEEFRRLIDRYLQLNLTKGVPPLFIDLRSLYSDPDKVLIIEDLILGYVTSLKDTGRFPKQEEKGNGDDAKVKSDDKEEKAPACALLWTYYYLAQHFDHKRQTEKALEYIDLAIDHTPTLIELLILKARCYKHAGDVEAAWRQLDEAQSLDTADRYVNSKFAKYLLRANRVPQAILACSKFTRDGVSPLESLNEMQCMWFQTECAFAYQREGQWGEALKKCHEIDRHFSEIIEDQFDFHTYCLRKLTLRSYVGLLRLEDVLRGHRFYFKAAQCAIQVYLHLFDEPAREEGTKQEIDTENLTPSELKKLRSKIRKARLRAQTAEPQKRTQTSTTSENIEQEELVPEQLERTEQPLDEAIKFLKPLQLLAKDKVETHLMAFEIYYRKGKILLMLQSILRANLLSAENSHLHWCLLRFCTFLSAHLSSYPVPIQQVVSQLSTSILQGRTAEQINVDYLQRNGKRLDAVRRVAEGMYWLNKDNKEQAIALVMNIDHVDDVTIDNCTAILQSLRSNALGPCENTALLFAQKCHQIFPYASAFRPPLPPPQQQTTATTQN